MWTAASSALAPAIPPEVNGVQVGEVVPLVGSIDVDQTSRAGGASRRSRQQDMGFRRLQENSGAQVQKSRPHEAQWYYPADGPFT